MRATIGTRVAGLTVAAAMAVTGFVAVPAHASEPATTTRVARTLEAQTSKTSTASTTDLDRTLASRLNVPRARITPQTSQSLAALTTDKQKQQALAQVSAKLDAQLPQLTDEQTKQILQAVLAIWQSTNVALGTITIPALAAALASAGVPSSITTVVATIIWNVITVTVTAILQAAIDGDPPTASIGSKTSVTALP